MRCSLPSVIAKAAGSNCKSETASLGVSASVKLDLSDLSVAWINECTMADTKTSRKEVQSYEILLQVYLIDTLWIILVHLTFGVSGND